MYVHTVPSLGESQLTFKLVAVIVKVKPLGGFGGPVAKKSEESLHLRTLHKLVQSNQSSLLNGSWACESSTDTSTSPPNTVLWAQITSRFSFLTSKGLFSSSIIRFTLDTRTVWALLKFRGKSCWRRRRACSNTLYNVNIRHNSCIQLILLLIVHAYLWIIIRVFILIW